MAKLPDFITAENELDGQEHVYIAQGGKTRKTLLQKIKEFVIGTTTMGTTATDITGAIAEHTSQLNEKVNKTAIINNCNVTEEGFIADARQLKYLFDLITKINNTTSYTTDLNIEKSIISKYNSNTLNTPYKQGLVTAGIGVCLTFMDGELQIAFPYMDNKILMRNSKGTWVKVSA